jgi:hypothetical protein
MLDGEEVREHVLVEARQDIHGLVRLGMSADEIEETLKERLNETERDLVWILARHEIDRGPTAKLHLESDGLILPAS